MRGDRHTILAKIALTIIVAACLVSAGYSSGTDMPGDHGSVAEPLAGTAWDLAAFRADNGSVIAPLPGAEPLIIFGESGTVSGSAGCNLYSASYRVDDGRLILSGPSGRDLLIFSRTEEPERAPLLGTAWRLTRYSTSGSAVAAPIADTGIDLIFEDDGTLSGSAGCNTYSAPYRVNETGLTVDRVIATKTSASEPAGIMEQEAAYLTLLRSAAGYRIVGDALVIIDGDGTAILFYEAEP